MRLSARNSQMPMPETSDAHRQVTSRATVTKPQFQEEYS